MSSAHSASDWSSSALAVTTKWRRASGKRGAITRHVHGNARSHAEPTSAK